MAEKKKKRGVLSRRGPVRPSNVRPYNPDLKQVSKEEFKIRRKREDEANRAGEEARQRVLNQHKISKPQADTDDKRVALEERIKKVKSGIKKARDKVKSSPESKTATAQLAKLTEQLDDAEDQLDELEES